MSLLPIPALVGMLADRAEQLAAELLPNGRREGTEWVVGGLDNRPGRGVQVHIGRGIKAGVWADFHSGNLRGDALDLVAQVLFRGDKVAALRWSRRWLGLDSGGAGFQTHQAAAPLRQAAAERDEEGKRLSAMKMWLDAKPILNTPAAAYLAGRGLPLEGFGRAPGALRFLAECWCAEAQANLPAMVAAVTRGGEHVATHRTWLAQVRGSWGKAPLERPKKVLGRLKGGVIPVWRGLAATPLRSCQAGETVAIAEGIEDALTIAWHWREWRTLAAYSLSNLPSLVLPEGAADLVLIFDRDGENPQAAQAREQAVRAFMEQDRSVRVTRPPEGHKDFNAWHQSLAPAQRESAA